MDDGRTALHSFKHGWRWSLGSIKYCKWWEQEDLNLSRLEVTKRIIEGTMGGLEDYLKFTMETEEEFEDGWLPTLDNKLKVSASNIIMYQFFEKPTNPNTELHQRKAMAEDAKLRSLTNEVIRRMVTTIPEETICQILDRFPQKMANNGYGVLQIRRVILAGIRGDWKGRGRGNSTGLKRKAAT